MEEESQQIPVKRSYVKKMFDSIMDMRQEDRLSLIEQLEDIAVDEALETAKASEGAMLSDYSEEIKEHSKLFGKRVGLSCGIEVVDDMTMGLAPGELTIVAGPTSAFKTGLCLNMAANIAQQGKFVGFITLEMTKPEIGSRLSKILDNEGFMDFFYVNKADDMNWKSVDFFVKKAIEDAGIEILFIDHLHYFARSMDNQATELGLITKEFKKIAIKYKIPVVLISHTRKTDNAGIERRATMNDLRGSSFIAQDADIVLMVNKVTKPDGTFASDKTEITLNKNRNRFCVDIGASWQNNRNGLKLQGRLSMDERNSWNRNKPKINTPPASFSATQSVPSTQSGINTHNEVDKRVENAPNASNDNQQIGLDFSASF